MDKRQGPSISVKMILATTALIIMIVAGFGALNVWNIGRVYDETSSDAELKIRQQLHEVGNATVQTLAASARTYFQQSNTSDMQKYVAQLAKSSEKISFIYVVDVEKQLMAHSDQAKNPAEGF